VLPDSPASRAGLKPHDEVKSIDGRSFWHFAQVAEYLKVRKGQPVALRIGRGDETVDKPVTPLVPLNTTNKAPYRHQVDFWWRDEAGVSGRT